MRLDTNTFIGIRNYDTSTKTAAPVFMEKTRDNKVIYNLRAETMRWDTATQKWQLRNAAERIVDSMGERMTMHQVYSISLNLKPEDLRRDLYVKDKLTTPELVAFIKRGRTSWHRRPQYFKSGTIPANCGTCSGLSSHNYRCRYCQPQNPGRQRYAYFIWNWSSSHIYPLRPLFDRICDQRKFFTTHRGLGA